MKHYRHSYWVFDEQIEKPKLKLDAMIINQNKQDVQNSFGAGFMQVNKSSKLS